MPYSVAMLSVHTSPLDSPGRTKDAGGMNVYMRELAKELAQQNLTVDIFTRWTDEYTPQVVQVTANLRVIHIQAGPLASISKHEIYQYLPQFARNIEEFRSIERRQYDILHSHYWLSGVAGLQLARLWDVPHVIMFHTLGKLKQLANPNEPEPPLRLEMEQRLIQQVDYIIAATAEERQQLIRACGAVACRVEVIPCGVDLKLFVPQERSEARERLDLPLQRPLVLFVGRLDPFKGPDLLLRAAGLMQEDAQILIVGGKLSGDKDLQNLQALADELQLSQRVSFLGARPQEELPRLYSAADVTVIPSYHESFGLVAVESLACGTPVVATRAGGLATVVQHGETGFLVPRCPGFFAERIDAIVADPELQSALSTAARRSVLHYSWKSVACKVSKTYEMLISTSPCLAAQ